MAIRSKNARARYANRHAMKDFFFLSHERRFMFLSVSKNACSSLKSMLHTIEFGRDFVPGGAMLEGVHRFWGWSERSGRGRMIDRRNARALARYPDYLRFVVYRDPVDRLLSTYHNKVLCPPHPHPYFTRTRLEGLALSPFLDIVEQILSLPDARHIDEHLRPQRRCYEPEEVDYIVRLDALDDFLAEKIGITRRFHHNATGPIRIEPTDEERERIRELYREDLAIEPNYPASGEPVVGEGVRPSRRRLAPPHDPRQTCVRPREDRSC